MNFHILFCSSRHVTIELDEDAIYETASYEIWVNGRLKGVFHRMIQTISYRAGTNHIKRQRFWRIW